MKLYEQTLEAINQHDMYRSPDLDDWIKNIDEVLSILKEPTIDNDKVDRLYLTKEALEIHTSYSVRCCLCTNNMSVPMEILKAEDPIKMAEEYMLEKTYKETKYEFEKAQAQLDKIKAKLEGLEKIYKGATK